MAILPIEVKESGITQTNRKIKELDKSADKLTGTFSGVTAGAMRLAGGIAALVGIGQLTRSFIQNADAMTNMNSQLKLVTKSTSELLQVQNQLFNISQSSRTSLQGTTELYAKIARNTKDLNVSNKELLKVTETISKAMTISGGSAESMNAAIVQLSQGFASGTLRGEELNSVMEQTPRLAEAIAEGMGKSLGELRALGAEGKLTAQAVMEALKSQAETIDTEFKNVGTTVSQSMTQVSNSTLMLVGDMDKAFGVTNQLSSSLTELSKVLIDNKDDIIDVGQDIIAGATIVANGLESIYLVSKIGYMKLGVAFKSEIEAVLNAIIEAFESSLNYITKEINQSTDYWNKALGLDIGTISEVSLGRVTIDTNDLSKSIEDANSRIQELGKSTDAAFIEIAMGAEQVVVAVDMVSKKTSEIKATSLLGTKEDRELAIEQSQQLADLIIKALDYIKSDTDKINEKNLEMYNVMQSIWDDTEMQKFFKKWQKEIDDVTKKSDKYDGIGSKDWTAGLKGQAKDIANIGNAFSDLGKEQKEWAKYSKENATSEEDKATHLDNQLGLYGNIAGAISNMAAEGSAAAKVAQVAQAALAIVQGASAILSQGTGDPYTAIPRMIAMAATVAQVLGNAGIGGGGGGAISGATIQESQFNSAITELTMQPMLDRLDRQIELLEIIGLEGTAGRARLSQADLQYRMDTKLLAEEIIRGTQTLVVQEGVGQASGVLADWNNRFVEINKTVGDSLFTLDEANKAIYFNAQVFRENTLGSLSAIYENELLNVLANWEEAQKEGARTWEQFNAFATATGTNTINELQGITHDYIMTLGDVVESMADAKDNFKDIYDELTGLNAYAERDLKEAFNRVSSLVSNSGSESFAQYLSKQVEAIEKVQSRFNTDITELFLSTNPDDLQKQADALKELNLVMDNAFGDGVQSALDYLDAIDLVSEAMITSKDNLESS
jgi:tape measure domain-containing protein